MLSAETQTRLTPDEIDIASGDYEIGPEHLPTAKKLRARHPDASLYGLKIGYPATVAIGGTLRPLKARPQN